VRGGEMMETLNFAIAAKRYFGYLPGETTAHFVQELKALTKEDKEELAPLLGEELGVVVNVA
jgi:hypothetical protein